MFSPTSTQNYPESQAADVLIPLIRVAATIGFAIAPCSLGFVIIAVSEQLIRSILVGDDPEMLVSDLQNQFPHDALEVAERGERLVAQVVALIDRQNLPVGSTVSYASLAEQIDMPNAARAVAQASGELAQRASIIDAVYRDH